MEWLGGALVVNDQLVRGRWGVAAEVGHMRVVPSGHYFMLGDSRYNSKDGRYWGFVPRENVRGRPLFVYYSYEPNPDSPVPWITDIRWSRIGHRIR